MRIYEDLRGLQGRLAVVQWVIVGLLALLTVNFWQLQVLRGKYYRNLAENNRIRPVPIPAPRGLLFDRNGRVLVDNRPSFNVVLTTEQTDNLDWSVKRLSQLLQMEAAAIREKLSQKKGPQFRAVVVKADATEQDVATIEARRLEQPEASVDPVPLRAYPLGQGAAHVLGRVGEITERQLESEAYAGIEPGVTVGQAGVEAEHNRLLMGKDGLRRVVVNSRGVEVAEAERQSPVEGPSVSLTLDMKLQQAMEEAMAGRPGSAVALDPRNGEILAMVSLPSYDPNEFAKGIEPAAWNVISKDPLTPLMNRVIQGQYSPGSSFKVMMSLAALQEGVITPQTRFNCPGYLNIYNTTFRCHKESGHGTVDLKHALALSCNVYFYNVGVRLGIERISKYARRLGLSVPTGVDLPAETSGLIPDPDWKRKVYKDKWYPSETVSISIGQGGVLATPLQMARLAAVVANGGRLVKPHLIKAVAGVPVAPPEAVDLGFHASVVEGVRAGMMAVVTEGTGRRAGLAGIAVAGKTGSAQVVTHARFEADRKAHNVQPHGWFVCFAPAEKPTIAMAVLVEHGTAGGTSAAPVAGQVLSHYFGVPMAVPQVAAPDPEQPVPLPSPAPPRAAP
jgi:penicillin-binding protein 2